MGKERSVTKRAKEVWLIATLVAATAVVCFVTTIAPVARAQPTSTSSRPSGRYVALQPPPAGDNTYGNFLWVLDSATGQVAVYRITSVKGEAEKHEFWMSERLITDEEYYKMQPQKK
jgi:hypothetical protein